MHILQRRKCRRSYFQHLRKLCSTVYIANFPALPGALLRHDSNLEPILVRSRDKMAAPIQKAKVALSEGKPRKNM